MKNQEEILKETLMAGIKETSEAMSQKMASFPDEVLVSMTGALYNQIKKSGFPIEAAPYTRAFDNILSGKYQIYNLNVISLMVIFRAEVKEFKDKTFQTPEKW